MRGLYGLNKFDQNGQSYCNIIVTQVKDGKYSVVAITPSTQALGAGRRQVGGDLRLDPDGAGASPGARPVVP